MNKTINLGNKKYALSILNNYKENEYVPFDVQVTNSHITDLNELIGKKIFKKETLYINSYTLWELMQPVGGKGEHNYHGLTVEDVYMGLSTIKNPVSVFITKKSRYAIITTELSHFEMPLSVIVEVGAGTKEDPNANINKIVTIYPKDHIDKIIKSINEGSLLYPKKTDKKKK